MEKNGAGFGCVTEHGGAVTAHWSENSFFVRLLNSALGVQLEAKGETGGGGLEQTHTHAEPTRWIAAKTLQSQNCLVTESVQILIPLCYYCLHINIK